MKTRILIVTFVLIAWACLVGIAQEPTRENAAQLEMPIEQREEMLRILVTREREAAKAALEDAQVRIARCNENLSEVWAKGNRAGRDLVKLQVEFDKMKKDYDNVVKQLNERSNPPDGAEKPKE